MTIEILKGLFAFQEKWGINMAEKQNTTMSQSKEMRVDAEWLFSSHVEMKGRIASFSERIRQLSNASNESQIIAGLQLPGSILESMGCGSSDTSKTEMAMLRYGDIAAAESHDTVKEIAFLSRQIHDIQEMLFLYDAVVKGLTESEKWLVDQYYEQGRSLDSLVLILEERRVHTSKSTLRRRKIQIIQKAQRLLDMLSPAKD
ncbi:MAG: hypothetical protein IJ242_14760 [Clostridia bacterium]|nr:hypothetical protein [Clostridia bacterium]